MPRDIRFCIHLLVGALAVIGCAKTNAPPDQPVYTESIANDGRAPSIVTLQKLTTTLDKTSTRYDMALEVNGQLHQVSFNVAQNGESATLTSHSDKDDYVMVVTRTAQAHGITLSYSRDGLKRVLTSSDIDSRSLGRSWSAVDAMASIEPFSGRLQENGIHRELFSPLRYLVQHGDARVSTLMQVIAHHSKILDHNFANGPIKTFASQALIANQRRLENEAFHNDAPACTVDCKTKNPRTVDGLVASTEVNLPPYFKVTFKAPEVKARSTCYGNCVISPAQVSGTLAGKTTAIDDTDATSQCVLQGYTKAAGYKDQYVLNSDVSAVASNPLGCVNDHQNDSAQILDVNMWIWGNLVMSVQVGTVACDLAKDIKAGISAQVYSCFNEASDSKKGTTVGEFWTIDSGCSGQQVDPCLEG